MNITKSSAHVVIYNVTPAPEDEVYQNCMFARFMFDLDTYTLNISGDVGDYTYHWRPTPGHEPFLALMARITPEYLLSEMPDKIVYDEETSKTVVVKLLQKVKTDYPEYTQKEYSEDRNAVDEYSPWPGKFMEAIVQLNAYRIARSYFKGIGPEFKYHPSAMAVTELFKSVQAEIKKDLLREKI